MESTTKYLVFVIRVIQSSDIAPSKRHAPQLTLRLPPTRINRRPLPIYRNHVLGPQVPLRGGARTRLDRAFERSVLEEAFDVVHRDEGGRGGGDDDDGVLVACK